MDAVTCHSIPDKMRWAFNLYDRTKKGFVDRDGLNVILRLLDQVESDGFMNGATEDELDELTYR